MIIDTAQFPQKRIDPAAVLAPQQTALVGSRWARLASVDDIARSLRAA